MILHKKINPQHDDAAFERWFKIFGQQALSALIDIAAYAHRNGANAMYQCQFYRISADGTAKEVDTETMPYVPYRWIQAAQRLNAFELIIELLEGRAA